MKMANSSTTMNHERTLETVANGATLEALAGLGAVALTIIALAGAYPAFLAAVASIIIGGALLFEGAAIAARYSRLVAEPGNIVQQGEVSSGLTAEFVGGAAGVVLGILALVGVHPTMLVPVAALVFGGSLIIGSAANARLSQLLTLASRSEQEEQRNRAARETVSAASGAEFLLGAAAAVLGILAIVGVGSWLSLSLVAFLSVATAVLFTGTAVSGRLMSYFSH
jgi:signal transduction histidine kinase